MKAKYPPTIFSAFNPVVLEIEKENEEETEAIINLTAYNGKWVNIELSREFINNTVKFDLSDVFKKLFEDLEKPFLDRTDLFNDYNLCVFYEIGGKWISLEGHAINAVKQIGESSDLTLERGTFRTNFDRLYMYEGYPRALAILGFEGETYVNFEDEEYTDPSIDTLFLRYLKPGIKYISISNEAKFPHLVTNAGEIVTDNDGNILYVYDAGYTGVYKYIETYSVPDNPFYVRWINQQGGWDYWMFSFRQTINRSIENLQYYNPTVFNQETAGSFTEVYHKEGVEKITVGTSGLNQNQYECISKLIYSPRIDYYDAQKKKWFRLVVDSGENENDTRSPEKHVEFTFVLPTPQLQF